MAKRPSASRAGRSSDGGAGGTRRGGWYAWPARAQHAVAAALLAALSVAFFAPVHFGEGTLVGGDTVNWRAMAEAMLDYEAETGTEALWNPNAFAGMPGYMIQYSKQVPQLDTLVTAVRKVAWPSSHMVVLLWGVYALVYVLTRDSLSGLVAAPAFGLTTYLPIILTAGHNTKFIALAYAPWLVLAFVYALQRAQQGGERGGVSSAGGGGEPSWRGGLLRGLLFAVALAVNLRAGHVQITYYVTWLLAVWWLAEGVAAWRGGRQAAFGRATGWLALGGVLGLLMVAQPYLVSAEYKTYTIRGSVPASGGGAGGLDLDYAMRWSQGPAELLTLAVADAFGGGPQTYWGPKPFTEGPHYLGGVVLMLATLALVRVRRAATVGLGVGAGLMVLFALGRHLPFVNEPLFQYFPLFDAFRAPETWLSVAALALAVLAGLGAWGAARPPQGEADAEAATTTRAVYGVSAAAVVLALVLAFAGPSLFDFERPDEAQQVARAVAQQNDLSPTDRRVQRAAERYLTEQRTRRARALASDARRTLVFVLLAAGLLAAARREVVPAWALQAGLALLVVVDLWGVDKRYFTDDDLAPVASAQERVATYGFDRFVVERQREAGGPGHFRVLSLEAGDPMTNARPSFHYESLGGYHGAKLQRYQDFIDYVFRDPATGRISETALDLLSARYIIAPRPLPGTREVYRDERTGRLVLENPDAAPRAFFVGATEVIPDPEATWARLRDPAFEPTTTAILPEPLPDGFQTTPLDAASTATVRLDRFTPREIRWTLETDAPRLLVASEIYYPAGWTATLDGAPVPIHRVDYLLRGVAVPAGTHTLVMRFAPTRHTLGVWVSGVSTALVYGGTAALLGLAYVRREPAAPEGEAPARTPDQSAGTPDQSARTPDRSARTPDRREGRCGWEADSSSSARAATDPSVRLSAPPLAQPATRNAHPHLPRRPSHARSSGRSRAKAAPR